MKLELYRPVNGRILQRFGENPEYYSKNIPGLVAHNGIDFESDTGTPVRAAHDGKITFAGQDGAGGWTVVLHTNEPREYAGGEAYFKTIYGHLMSNIPLFVGENVTAGTVIGYSDNSGLSNRPHLHFALKPVAQGEADWIWDNIEQQNGYFGAIDPAPYLSNFSAEIWTTWGAIKLQWEAILASWPGVSPALINALIQVESEGNNFAIGDKDLADHAFGCLQIRKPVVDDVNRVFGTNHKAEDMYGNRKLSIWVCSKYLSIWATDKKLGRPVTDQDRARIWNGGPDGWQEPETRNYWEKVKVAINTLT